MSPAVLFPHFDGSRIDQRFAGWRAATTLRQSATEFHFYEAREEARDVAASVRAHHVLVVTDPLIVPPPHLAARLQQALDAHPQVFAALPCSTNPVAEQQRARIHPFTTMRELEEALAAAASDSTVETMTWDASSPGAFLCVTDQLDSISDPLAHVLAGREVALARGTVIHQPRRRGGEHRLSLLPHIPADVKSVLDLDCANGELGAAIKQRGKCRVVGIESSGDPTQARQRLDDVYIGEMREIISILDERFDLIVGGEIVEELDEPWTFVADLRRLSAPHGQLLLTVPNIANASVINDLLSGRFDYLYDGLISVPHLRFFTRHSIEELLRIAGWTSVTIATQNLSSSPVRDQLTAQLEASKIPFSRDDLTTASYVVVARNPA